MAARGGVNRYPRPGDRIAPITLSQVLTEPAPDRLVAGTPAEGLELSQLDETIWEKLPLQAVFALAEIVVDRVAAACARKLFHRRHFPRPPEGLALEELRLEHRTHLCLEREGFGQRPERLGDRTIGEVLAIRAFGPRCLVDLLSALETFLARGSRLDRQLTMEAGRLAHLPEAARARSDDPRFGPLMQEVDVRAATAKDLAARLLARTQDPPDPSHVTEQLHRLWRRIVSMPERALEEELIAIFASTPHCRNREIVIGYYGWADGRSHTLAEIGARYGMTRERTRQICAKLVRRSDPASILAPVTDRTLDFVARRLPRPVAGLEKEIADAGLTAVGMRLEGVEAAARLLGRAVPFRIVPLGRGRLAVRPHQAAVPAAAAETARKEAYYHGASTVGRIVELLSGKYAGRVDAALVAEAIQLIDDFCWLDRAAGWFRLASVSKHGLPKAIDKVLAVAGQIRVADLQAAIQRSHRIGKTRPPQTMLLEFCRQMPGVRVEGDLVIADPAKDWQEVLTGVEARLVGVLKQHGPVMERSALEELCVADGMNRFSFHAFLASSPVIAQYGHSVYGLLGAVTTPESVRSLVAKHRAERTAARVLDKHGRTADGRIWLSYRLSKAASTYAVITVPAALKEVVSGKFELVSAEGRRVGVLAAKDGRAWGLGSFLRKQGARPDDYLVVTLDLDRRKATVALDGKPWIPQ